MGLPCAHDLYPFINQDRKVTLDLVDRHWWLPTQSGIDTFAEASRSHPLALTTPIVLPDEYAAFDDLDNAILDPVIRTFSGAPKRIDTQTERRLGSKKAQEKRLERERKQAERAAAKAAKEAKQKEAEAVRAKKAAERLEMERLKLRAKERLAHERAEKAAEREKKKADKGKRRARPSPVSSR